MDMSSNSALAAQSQPPRFQQQHSLISREIEVSGSGPLLSPSRSSLSQASLAPPEPLLRTTGFSFS